MKLLIVTFVVLALASEALAGRKNKRRLRGCRRAAGNGVTEEGAGSRFVWTLTGLDDDDLRVTYSEGAFAPDGATTVFKYPHDRGQRALGLVPAKIVYDFSSGQPVAVIRQGRRGRGSCIVINNPPDVTTYDEMIGMLFDRNATNGNVPELEQSERLLATLATDDSQFSEVVREICSRDQCGESIQAVYYTTENVTDETDEEEEEEMEEDFALEFEPSFLLFNTRVTISDLPHPREQRWQRRQERRQSRRQHRHDTAGREGRRQQGRQQRRQQRQQRRQQRRNSRRQGEDDAVTAF